MGRIVALWRRIDRMPFWIAAPLVGLVVGVASVPAGVLIFVASWWKGQALNGQDLIGAMVSGIVLVAAAWAALFMLSVVTVALLTLALDGNARCGGIAHLFAMTMHRLGLRSRPEHPRFRRLALIPEDWLPHHGHGRNLGLGPEDVRKVLGNVVDGFPYSTGLAPTSKSMFFLDLDRETRRYIERLQEQRRAHERRLGALKAGLWIIWTMGMASVATGIAIGFIASLNPPKTSVASWGGSEWAAVTIWCCAVVARLAIGRIVREALAVARARLVEQAGQPDYDDVVQRRASATIRNECFLALLLFAPPSVFLGWLISRLLV